MSGGRKVKQRGTSYEVRVAKWFDNLPNWQGKRVPLSGASDQINEAFGGKADVRAWNDSLGIYLLIECKKKGDARNPDEVIIQNKWLGNLDFDKDNILVFATNRSSHYAFLPVERYFKILGRRYDVEHTPSQVFKGKSQFLFKREWIDNTDDKIFHLKWADEPYVIILLSDYVTLRETANLDDKLSIEDQIKRLTSLEKAIEFEKLNLATLNYKQKVLMYSKLEQLESGEIISPFAHADEQFWMSDDKKYILTCPNCAKNIMKSDLKKD